MIGTMLELYYVILSQSEGIDFKNTFLSLFMSMRSMHQRKILEHAYFKKRWENPTIDWEYWM